MLHVGCPHITLSTALPMQVTGRDEKKPQKVTLTLCSFAVSRRAYQRITERFAKEYEAATGQPIQFRLSFGGSGTQVCLHRFVGPGVVCRSV